VDAVVVWVYVAFLFLVLFSLLGYTESIALERLIVFPFGALVLLQFRSSVGLRSVTFAAIAASLTVSIWVIVRAVQGDFEYRGNIDVNQNVVSVYIGLGFMAALAERIHGYHGPRRGLVTALVVLALGVMAYALVLLASRGMIIAVLLASFALFIRVAWIDRGRLRFFLVLLVVATLGLLLPGGAGVFARFEDPNTITGGGRVEIWAAIGEELTNANLKELLVGHGFESSQRVVQRRFATLTSAHNAYLQVLFDYGLLGLILFLTLHGHAMARSWTIRGRDGALILGLVTFLLASNLFMTTPDNFMYWTALGFVLAIGSWHEAGARRAPPIPSGGAVPMATSSRDQDPTSDR
jgi:O-antigen ligase